jgi:hypothetical protein
MTEQRLRMIHADYISTITRLHTDWTRHHQLVLQELERAEKKTERARTLLGRLHEDHKKLQSTHGVPNDPKSEASLATDILNELNLGKGKEGECVINLKKTINGLMEDNEFLKSKVVMLEKQICDMEKRTEVQIELQLKRDKKLAQRKLKKAGSSSDESDASSWSGHKSGMKEGYRFPNLWGNDPDNLSNVSPDYHDPRSHDLHSNFVASPRYRNKFSWNKKRVTKRRKAPSQKNEILFRKQNTWKNYLTELEDEMKPAAKPAPRATGKRKVSLCPSLNQEAKVEKLDKSTSEEEF